MNMPVLKIRFTPGLGNNLFQYVFARLVAEKQHMKLSSPGIPELGINKSNISLKNGFPLKIIRVTSKTRKKSDNVFHKYLDKKLEKKRNIFLFGYFEDFTIYKSHLKRIRSWFPEVKKTNSEDVVLHLRLQNRVVQENHFFNFPPIGSYSEALKAFDFSRLHIVTDCEKWSHIGKKDVSLLRKKYPPKTNNYISAKKSIEYMNSLVDELAIYNPIIHHNKKFIDDFNFIRSFDKILINNSTFAWWAATLSKASKIGVYGPWKPNKGKIRNKNLGRTNYPGWFSWS